MSFDVKPLFKLVVEAGVESLKDIVSQNCSDQLSMEEVLGLPHDGMIDDFVIGKRHMNKRTYSLALLVYNQHQDYQLKLKANLDLSNSSSDNLVLIDVPKDGVVFKELRNKYGLAKPTLAKLLALSSKDSTTEF